MMFDLFLFSLPSEPDFKMFVLLTFFSPAITYLFQRFQQVELQSRVYEETEFENNAKLSKARYKLTTSVKR